MDKKGRTVLKKDILDKAGLDTPCTMLASVRDDGVIELKKIGERLSRATTIGAKRLKGWREEKHAGEKALLEMVKHETD